MFNVIELTSRLAKMSDPQLRQYAQMHKDDPYTLALAAAENKRRAQLRASGQQQPPQATVADQLLSQMGAPAPQMQQPQQPQQMQLPEDQGIGMLPAQNMAGMADGGIAGYADGGMVAFADGDLVRGLDADNVPMTGFGRAIFGASDRTNQMMEQQRLQRLRELAQQKLQKYSSLGGYFFEPQTQQQRKERSIIEANLDKIPPEQLRAFVEKGTLPTIAAPAPEQFQAPAPVEKKPGWAVEGKKKGEKASYPAPIDEGDVYTPRTSMAPDTFAPYNKNTQAGRNASAKQGSKTTPPPPPSETMKEPTSDFTASKETTMEEQLKALEKLSPGTKAYDDLKRDIQTGFTQLRREREESKPKGKPYEGLEALLKKEEDKAKGKEARNFNMALINAGLAIAGGKSQNALQNIAEGAQVGTKQYQEGLEKLEAAEVERRKQAALIEEARRAEARGDWKEANDYKQKAFEAGIGVDKERISAIQDIFKTNAKTAADIVNTASTNASNDRRVQYQQKNENFRAQLREVGDNWRLVAKNANDIKVAQVYSAARAAYGASAGDKIWDNARQRHDSWLKTPEGKLADSAAIDSKFEYYLNEATKAYGGASGGNKNPQQNPYAGWGNLQVTPGTK
jgi:membrane-bound inhibitor of C-type lysozyme